ncbi:MAG: biotin/lipoyl-containing protein [Candidatus Zixiibacteriota bacterium]
MPRYHVTIGEKEFDIMLEYLSEKYYLNINDCRSEVVLHRLSDTRALLFVNERSYEVDIRPGDNNGDRLVFMTGLEIPAKIEDYHLAKIRKTAGMASAAVIERIFKAPMPGLVLEVRVAPGDKVVKGQPLLVIEAMKMENIIKAKGPATVKAIHVAGGTSVEKGDKLLEFE